MKIRSEAVGVATTLRSLRVGSKLRALRALTLCVIVVTAAACQSAATPTPREQAAAAPAPRVPDDRELYARAVPALPTEPLVGDEAAFAAARAEPRGATLQTITVYGSARSAKVPGQPVRVVLGFDGVAAFRRGELPAADGLPRRVVLDLDGAKVADSIRSLLNVGAGGLARVRAFPLSATTTRLSFDVEANAVYRLFLLVHPYRVIMDFRQVPARPALPASALRTVVLDPGHGGSRDGAHGPNGLEESSVVLSLAKRVKRVLARKLPATRVVLTRDADRTVSLEERSAIANSLDADLFVSIHLDASPAPNDRGGVSTYVLDTSDDVQALRLAARENEADEKDITDLQKLFASLYRKDQVARSLEVAGAIHASTLKSGRTILPDLPDRGVKKALFYVLVGASMPAVLCEASFITRPDEAAALATEEYRDALAEGIADGIVSYADKLSRTHRPGAR